MGPASAPFLWIAVLLAAVLPLPLGEPSTDEGRRYPDIDLLARFPEARLSLGEGETPDRPPPPRPWIRPDKGWLLVPFGTSVTYDLEVGPDATLLTANVSSRGSATGRLEVDVEKQQLRCIQHQGAVSIPGNDGCVSSFMDSALK